MAIVVISKWAYSQGDEVAEKVAEKLGFECASREILIEASKKFNIPEIKLLQAVRDNPSALDRFTHESEMYVAYTKATLLEHLKRDNVVYHGLEGHYFVKGVAHALKVRIIGNEEDRLKILMQRGELFEKAASAMNGVTEKDIKLPRSHRKISKDKALQILEGIDQARRSWGLKLFGLDPCDSSLYDLVIQIGKYSIDDAAEMICQAARLPQFQTTPESQKVLDNLVLAARVRSAIIRKWREAEISADSGNVVVHLEAPLIQEAVICKQILPIIRRVPGVRGAQVHVLPTTLLGTSH